MTTVRNKSADGLKYLLIVLVIFGHFVEPSRYNNEIVCRIYSVIYSFHMPLFVLLSGYFFKSRTIKEELLKCLPLLEACLISHAAFVLIRDHSLSLLEMLKFGSTPTWYFISLILWRLSFSLLIKKSSAKKILVLSIVTAIVSFIFLNRNYGVLSLMRTLQYYPYFVTGYLLKEQSGRIDLKKYKRYIFPLGLIATIVIIHTSCRLQHVTFFQRESVQTLAALAGRNCLYTFFYRYLMVVCGIFTSASVYILFADSQWIQRFAKFGQGTLFIYFGQNILFPLANKYFSALVPSLIAVVVAVCGLTLLSLKPISKWMMNPLNTLFKKILRSEKAR